MTLQLANVGNSFLVSPPVALTLAISVRMSQLPQPSSTSSPSTQHIVDDRDPSIVYSGSGWVAEGTFPEYDNTTHGSNLNGASMAFGFEGTQVSVYGSVPSGPNKTFPCAIFSVGSHPPVTFTPIPSQSRVFWKVFYTSPELPQGTHLLNMTIYTGSSNCGDKTPHERFWFDFLEYTGLALVTSAVRHDVLSPTNVAVVSSTSIPGNHNTTPFFVEPLPAASTVSFTPVHTTLTASTGTTNISTAASGANTNATHHRPAAGVVVLAVLSTVTAVLIIASAVIVIRKAILRRKSAAAMSRIQESLFNTSTPCDPVRTTDRRDSFRSWISLASTSSHLVERRPPQVPSFTGAVIWDRTSSVATSHDTIPAASADKYSKLSELMNSLLGRTPQDELRCS